MYIALLCFGLIPLFAAILSMLNLCWTALRVTSFVRRLKETLIRHIYPTLAIGADLGVSVQYPTVCVPLGRGP